jgi:hypothetical protein
VIWLEKTHGTRWEPVRHFLATLSDSEMFSVRGQWGEHRHRCVCAGHPGRHDPAHVATEANRDIGHCRSYHRANAAPCHDNTVDFDHRDLVLLAWQSLFPNRRDYFALAGLPLSSRQVFAARFFCTLLLAGILTTMLVLPALSPPHAIKLMDGTRWSPVSTIAARAAIGLGCLAVFCALVGLQGLFMNVLPAKWLARWSSYIQGILLGLALLAGLYSWFIPDWEPASVPHLLGVA